MIKYDLGIIGSGSAGTTVAAGMRQAGQTVAMFENYLWGGTCANYGCDPKKVIVNSIDVLRQAALFTNEVSGDLKLNWPAVMVKKQAYVSQHPENTQAYMAASGVEMYHEAPRFINENTVVLGDGTEITADKWVIASGKHPVAPSFVGSELAHNSEDFLNLSQMPADVTVIGGGYIAIELASIAHFAGAKVRILQHNDRVLRGFEPWLGETLVAELMTQGIDVQFNTEVEQLIQANGRIAVTTKDGAEFMTDFVLAATGRTAAVDGLDLTAAGVALEKAGVTVDQHLQTTAPNIYAVGDVAASGAPNLTPVAGYEARYLVDYLTGQTDAPITYPQIPTAVFSHPRIAQMGMSAAKATELGYQVSDYDLSKWFNYMRLNDHAKAQVITHDGKILGASLISEQADEIINMFATAINNGWTKADVQRQIMTYPTMISDLQYFY